MWVTMDCMLSFVPFFTITFSSLRAKVSNFCEIIETTS